MVFKIPNPNLPSQFSTFGSSVKGHFNSLFGSVQQWLGSGRAEDYVADTTSAHHLSESAPVVESHYEVSNMNSQNYENDADQRHADEHFHEVFLKETRLCILKRYTDLNVIGSGAQGLVLSAMDNVTNTQVAIKKLTRPFSNVTHAKRAYREFEIMNLVNHRNVYQKQTSIFIWP